MKILEERCDTITNMEVMLLLVQQQQLLPSVECLLRQASKPSSVNSGSSAPTTVSNMEPRKFNDREDSVSWQTDHSVERFSLDQVKELLYQHMFNQMVQDYIRKTCPYLHLVRAPTDARNLADRSRSHTAGVRVPPKRAPSAQVVNRRASGTGATRTGGVSPLISRRCRECLDVLFHRFGLTELELLTILNLGAFKPVEIYMYLDDCSSRFTEEEAAEMLGLIDLALVQQQPLPPLAECASDAPASMDVDSQAGTKKPALASRGPGELHEEQPEMQDEVTGSETRQKQAQQEAEHSIGLRVDAESEETHRNAPDGDQEQPRATVTDKHCSESESLFAPAEDMLTTAARNAGCAETAANEAKPRGRAVRGAAKRRPVSRRRRILDD